MQTTSFLSPQPQRGLTSRRSGVRSKQETMGLDDYKDSTYNDSSIPETEEVGISIPVNFTFTKEMLDKGDIPELIEEKAEEIFGRCSDIDDIEKVEVDYDGATEIPPEEAKWD